MAETRQGRARGLWEARGQGPRGRPRALRLPSGLNPADGQESGRATRGQHSTCIGSSRCRGWATATEGLRLAGSPLILGAAQERFTGLLHTGIDAPSAGRLAGGGGASSKWLLWARGSCLHWPPGALSCAQHCWGLPRPWAPRGHTPAYPTVLSKLPPSCWLKAPSPRTW